MKWSNQNKSLANIERMETRLREEQFTPRGAGMTATVVWIAAIVVLLIALAALVALGRGGQ